MPAIKTGMTNVAGHFCSDIGTVSQAVPAAMSQVHQQHMRTRLKSDTRISCLQFERSTSEMLCTAKVVLLSWCAHSVGFSQWKKRIFHSGQSHSSVYNLSRGALETRMWRPLPIFVPRATRLNLALTGRLNMALHMRKPVLAIAGRFSAELWEREPWKPGLF